MGTSDQKTMCIQFNGVTCEKAVNPLWRWLLSFVKMIIDCSGEGCKVWESGVISPAIIVDTNSKPYVGSLTVDGTGNEPSNL